MGAPNNPRVRSTMLSESQQMYLVSIARERTGSEPTPLSELAEVLAVSPVSVNEMCRRLQEQGLVVYRPYKGVSLTVDGERHAHHVLRRHRLWEAFLVEELGLDDDQAHDAACQLEHATPDLVVERLDAFLGRPAVNPKGDLIPRADSTLPAPTLVPLVALSVGQQGHVVRCEVDEASRAFLVEQGLRPGASLIVMATTEESLLLTVGEARMPLARTLAEHIQVELYDRNEKATREGTASGSTSETGAKQPRRERSAQGIRQLPLHKLNAGQRGLVVRLGGKGPAKRRITDMGLVPGMEVKMVGMASMGDPIEIEVEGCNLTVPKRDAYRVTVEVSSEQVG